MAKPVIQHVFPRLHDIGSRGFFGWRQTALNSGRRRAIPSASFPIHQLRS